MKQKSRIYRHQMFLIEFLDLMLCVITSCKKKEKEKQVLKLVSEGKTTREIAKAVDISLKDIGKIIRKVAGEDDSPIEKEGNWSRMA